MLKPIKAIARNAPLWFASLLLHATVFAVLAMFYVESSAKRSRVMVVSDLDELSPIEDFQAELTPDEALDLNAPVSLTPTSGSPSSAAQATASLANPLQTATQLAEAAQILGDRNLSRPLSGRLDGLRLDSNVDGIKGTNEIVSGGSDAGVVDRITQEILRQINKNKVIVAWILDSSGSLEKRRQAIADRLDRVYHELDELGVNEHDGLLTAVVAVGKRTQFLLDKPTKDLDKIHTAFRGITEDATGVENLFTAMRETTLKLRRIQTATRRTLMLVVMTDEIGDDLDTADDTVALLVRYRVPVYLMGPMASFSRPVLHDHWTDPETGFHFWIPVKRGPYTRREEILRVPFVGTAYRSGFGPFALTQTTRETGGIFFIYDDTRIPGAKYDSDVLNRYKANYEDAAAYAKEVGRSKFRRALMQVVEQGNEHWNGDGGPHGWIHHDAWRRDLEHHQKYVGTFLGYSRKAIPILQDVESEWEAETDQKWRAAYDLTYGRLLLARLRCQELNWAAEDFHKKPLILKNAGKNNGWHYYLTAGINVGRPLGQGASVAEQSKAASAKSGSTSSEPAKGKAAKPKQPKEAIAAQEMLEKALYHFKRTIEKHPGTPFAVAARSESSRRIAVGWREGYDPNYHKGREKEWQEARKRVPKR